MPVCRAGVASLGPLEPQLAGLEGTDVTHVGSGTEGSATPVPGGNPGQIGVKRQEQEPRRSNRKRRTLRRLLFTLTLLLIVVAAGVAWVGVDALRARGELRAAATRAAARTPDPHPGWQGQETGHHPVALAGR